MDSHQAQRGGGIKNFEFFVHYVAICHISGQWNPLFLSHILPILCIHVYFMPVSLIVVIKIRGSLCALCVLCG